LGHRRAPPAGLVQEGHFRAPPLGCHPQRATDGTRGIDQLEFLGLDDRWRGLGPDGQAWQQELFEAQRAQGAVDAASSSGTSMVRLSPRKGPFRLASGTGSGSSRGPSP
jgi:hypothetical protein